jgi:hypothetical protein
MLQEGFKQGPEPAREGEPTLEGAFAPDGVDLTAIRWMLFGPWSKATVLPVLTRRLNERKDPGE